MPKPAPSDFRNLRALLPDEVFALPKGGRKRRDPTDVVSEKTWQGIMHLPDDVAIMTSNHHGTALAALYTLWGDWIEAIGEEDPLFIPMLDAADCFQSSTFDSLHGYYRSALSSLRSALELVAIGALGCLVPRDDLYLRWKKSAANLAFPSCRGRLRRAAKEPVRSLLFKQGGWMDLLYYKLCDYAHSRPDSSDGAMWQSNGPIYVAIIFDNVFSLQTSTFAACYILVKVGRPAFTIPQTSEFLFNTQQLLWSDKILSSYNALYAGERA
jgi:hypothetical protein